MEADLPDTASCSRVFHACQSDFRSTGRPLASAQTRSWSSQRDTGSDALLELGGSVGPQGVDELDGQSQGAAAALGFGLLVNQALPGDPVQAAPHGQCSVGQVDVRPALALTDGLSSAASSRPPIMAMLL
jgi:hypothetical protein